MLKRRKVTLGIVMLLAAYTSMGASCDRRTVGTVAGQSGLAVIQSVGEVRKLTDALVAQKILTPEQGIAVLEKLRPVVEDVTNKLPPLLRVIDAGNPDQGTVDSAIAILETASENLSVVIGGVPMNETTRRLVDLIRATQKTVTTALLEVAKVRNQ